MTMPVLSPSVLRRFSTTILKNKSGSDTAQVPASATINFYHRGATVSSSLTIPGFESDANIDVYDVGLIVVGDTVQLDATSTSLLVTEVIKPTRVVVTNPSSSSANLAVGTRLVISSSSHRPLIYADPLGSVSLGSSITTDSDTGRASTYLAETRFDYVVSGSGLTARLYADAQIQAFEQCVDVRDFPTFQAAIDALSGAGGVVLVPPGTFSSLTTPSFTGVVIGSNVTLRGAGPETTVLDMTGQALSRHGIEINGDYVRVENLALNGQAGESSSGSGCGIYVNPIGNSRFNVWFDGVNVRNSPSWCIYWNSTPTLFTAFSGAKRCRFYLNRSNGSVYVGVSNLTVWFEECLIGGEGFAGTPLVHVRGATGIEFRRCGIEPETTDCVGLMIEANAASSTFAKNVVVDGCWFESHVASAATNYHVKAGLGVSGLYVSNCIFVRNVSPENLPPRIFELAPAEHPAKPKGVSIINCSAIENRTSSTIPSDDIKSDGPEAGIALINTTIWNAYNGNSRSMSIGGITPSYLFELANGFRFAIPQLTTDGIANLVPHKGMMAYDASTNEFKFYDGAWRAVVLT